MSKQLLSVRQFNCTGAKGVHTFEYERTFFGCVLADDITALNKGGKVATQLSVIVGDALPRKGALCVMLNKHITSRSGTKFYLVAEVERVKASAVKLTGRGFAVTERWIEKRNDGESHLTRVIIPNTTTLLDKDGNTLWECEQEEQPATAVGVNAEAAGVTVSMTGVEANTASAILSAFKEEAPEQSPEQEDEDVEPQTLSINFEERTVTTEDDSPVTRKPQGVRRAYLSECKLSEDNIKKVATYIREHGVTEADDPRNERIPRPKTRFYGHKNMYLAVMAMLTNQNILIVGEKAGGKNVLVDTLAWLFKQPLYTMSCDVTTDKFSMIGGDVIKDGTIEFREGIVLKAMREGAILCVDEINMATAGMLSVLNSITDGRRQYDVPEIGLVEASPGFRVIATMNKGYAGTKQLNEALQSRFTTVLKVDMLSEAELTDGFKVWGNTTDGIASKCSKLMHSLADKVKDGSISTRSLNIRGVLAACNMNNMGVNMYDALISTVVNHSDDEAEEAIVLDTLKMYFHP